MFSLAEPDEKKIDDIVATLDAFMSGGGGHMNIRCDGNEEKIVTTSHSRDCAGINTACSVPTLFEGMDHQ